MQNQEKNYYSIRKKHQMNKNKRALKDLSVKEWIILTIMGLITLSAMLLPLWIWIADLDGYRSLSVLLCSGFIDYAVLASVIGVLIQKTFISIKNKITKRKKMSLGK